MTGTLVKLCKVLGFALVATVLAFMLLGRESLPSEVAVFGITLISMAFGWALERATRRLIR
jgi:hypothetical protein